MARVVNQQEHRKELVAGGMVDYLVSSQSGSRAIILVFSSFPGYRGAAERLGNQAMDFYEVCARFARSNYFLRDASGLFYAQVDRST
jgi:hypothetical protein